MKNHRISRDGKENNALKRKLSLTVFFRYVWGIGLAGSSFAWRFGGCFGGRGSRFLQRAGGVERSRHGISRSIETGEDFNPFFRLFQTSIAIPQESRPLLEHQQGRVQAMIAGFKLLDKFLKTPQSVFKR